MKTFKATLFLTAGLIALGGVSTIAAPTWQKVAAGAGASTGTACRYTAKSPMTVLVPATTKFSYVLRGGGGGGGGGGPEGKLGGKGGDGMASSLLYDNSITRNNQQLIRSAAGGQGGAASVGDGNPGQPGSVISGEVTIQQGADFIIRPGGGGGGGSGGGRACSLGPQNGNAGNNGGLSGGGTGGVFHVVSGGISGSGGDGGNGTNGGSGTASSNWGCYSGSAMPYSGGSGGIFPSGEGTGGKGYCWMGLSNTASACPEIPYGTPFYIAVRTAGGGGGGAGGEIMIAYTAPTCFIP